MKKIWLYEQLDKEDNIINKLLGTLERRDNNQPLSHCSLPKAPPLI